ncbi:hypothetical protein HYPSUDRAFT_67037 [Hypholoma sublateritium FD-334 SS-4]|uniref:Uncharacterized protein n=1 Tax=Hypholoma sublateritium (strain FD-334 SS-4) TaxID=945553 RepID=A0A0D2P1I6_HYPSF|nr:hypothetical protein HYPSUDRAFT_67037 [Hypholoma sublateritium FD-334 SS-4]
MTSLSPAYPGRLVVSLDRLDYNFTLSAVNVTEPNANLTGAPLVLGQAGAIDGESFYVTSTYASYPYNDYPSLGLIDNTLRAYMKDGQWLTNTSTVQSGGTMSWYTTSLYTQVAPEIFTALKTPFATHALLAVYGISDLWSLCPFSGAYAQTNLIFNVSGDATTPPPPYLGFDIEQCYAVLVNIIPVAPPRA